MKQIILLCCACLLFFPSCKNNKNTTGCSVLCTASFAAVTVAVVHTNGQPATLDSCYTIRIPQLDTIRNQAKATPDDNVYTILDDSYQKQLQNQTADFRFMGFRAGKVAAVGTYTISADCCHVSHVGQQDTIVIP